MRRPPRWLVVFGTGVFLFLHLPVLVLVAFSFNASKFTVEWTGFTLEWYRLLAQRPDILRGAWVSLVVGGWTTLIATVAGTLLAMGIGRGRWRGRTALEGSLYLPVVTPEIVAGVSLLILFAALPVTLGVVTVIVAHVAFTVPFVTIVVLARLAGMDRSLEEAAMVLGADEGTVFWRVTLPQLWPAVGGGALLAFTLSFDDYVITSLVTGPGASTLPVVVYGMVRRTVEPTVNAVSAVILFVTTLLITGADRLTRGKAA